MSDLRITGDNGAWYVRCDDEFVTGPFDRYEEAVRAKMHAEAQRTAEQTASEGAVRD